MTDCASYTCPACGERICAERVVDDSFIDRINAHKQTHQPDQETTNDES